MFFASVHNQVMYSTNELETIEPRDELYVKGARQSCYMLDILSLPLCVFLRILVK